MPFIVVVFIVVSCETLFDWNMRKWWTSGFMLLSGTTCTHNFAPYTAFLKLHITRNCSQINWHARRSSCYIYLKKTFRCKTIHILLSYQLPAEWRGEKNLLDLKSNKKKMQFLFRQMRFSISHFLHIERKLSHVRGRRNCKWKVLNFRGHVNDHDAIYFKATFMIFLLIKKSHLKFPKVIIFL